MRLRTRRAPLDRRLPLHVLIEQDVPHELAPRVIDVGGFAALERRGPFRPRALVLAGMDRPKKRVVFDPPRLLADERLQLARARRIVTPVVSAEPLERGPQRRELQPADAGVVDTLRSPHEIERFTIGGRQRGFPADGGKLGDIRNADVHRIDGHRADRRVRRLLTGGPLVDRQELNDLLARSREPAGQRREIADIAGPPARRRRAGKQRDQQPGLAAARTISHG